MENTIIVDFFGLPGCGKSKRAHLLAQKLRENGKSVAETSYTIDHEYPTVFRKIVKILYTVRHYICFSNEARQVIALIKENGYDNALRQYVNIAYKLIKCKTEKSDYLIFDEGLCQAAISLAINNACNAKENRQVFEKLIVNRRYFPICVSVSAEQALERIAERGGCDSRVEQETDQEKRLLLMNKYYSAVKTIECECCIIDGQDAEIDVHRVMGLIE